MHDIPLPMKPEKSGITFLILVVASALLMASCTPSKEALRKHAADHPVMTVAYWGQEWQARPLHERIAPAPKELLDKIVIDNRLYDFPERPVAAEPAPEFLSALKHIEEILPEPVRRLARETGRRFLLLLERGTLRRQEGFPGALAGRSGALTSSSRCGIPSFRGLRGHRQPVPRPLRWPALWMGGANPIDFGSGKMIGVSCKTDV